MHAKHDFSGKIVLISGASRGIGAAAAKAFAAAGGHVIATGRTRGALEELDDAITAEGGSCTLVELELADRPALTRLAAAVAERWGKLDVMVANAGQLGVLTPTSHMDETVWDEVIDTNLSAVWRMIQAFEPLLLQAETPRAVLVSSGASQAKRPFWSAYAASKAGLNALGKTWAHETSSTALRVSILNPGRVATAMLGTAFPGIKLEEMPQPEDIAPVFLRLADPSWDDHGAIINAADLLQT